MTDSRREGLSPSPMDRRRLRIVVAGATGVIGRQLVPLLTAQGHEVVGIARSSRGSAAVDQAGARLIAVDALDDNALIAAVAGVGPDAVVNLLTAIPARINPRRMTSDFRITNRLRTSGTRALLAAARQAGPVRVVSQGLAYPYEPGPGLADETVALWKTPPAQFRSSLAALLDLEEQTTAYGGAVLRFGHLYGPGTIYASTGSFTTDVRAGKVPLVGGGHSVFSFIHVHDAATAIVAALGSGVTGPLNIVDDDPEPMSEWLPEFARMWNAPGPKSVPTLLAHLVAGGWGAAFMTRLRGADNTCARTTLGWSPHYPSWRDGLIASPSDE